MVFKLGGRVEMVQAQLPHGVPLDQIHLRLPSWLGLEVSHLVGIRHLAKVPHLLDPKQQTGQFHVAQFVDIRRLHLSEYDALDRVCLPRGIPLPS